MLEVRDLAVSAGEKAICKNLNLHIKPGDCWGILGCNGSGKTTLLHTLAGLRTPNSGEILLNGVALSQTTRRQIARQLGILLQHTENAFPSTVLETVLTGRHPHNNFWGNKDEENLAQAALEKVNMQDMAKRMTHSLSGGERRRLAIATLLCQAPQIYLLDEPTNHLDLAYQIHVLRIFAALDNVAVMMILHDVNLATKFCNKFILLNGFGEMKTGESIINVQNLQWLYQLDFKEIATPQGTIWLMNQM